jgi:DNA-binding NarL/FixJ family response regulator
MESEMIRVVVVDDHALHRDGTRQILEAHPDFQVVGEAASGEVALALVNQLGPDVVLMDIRLPGMNGIEVTRQLTQDHPGVRVLMVSAYDEDEYVRGALEAGAAGYLRKTAPGKELVEAVRAVAGGASVLQSGLTARLLISSREPERGAAACVTGSLRPGWVSALGPWTGTATTSTPSSVWVHAPRRWCVPSRPSC